jgi:hypothetical protein
MAIVLLLVTFALCTELSVNEKVIKEFAGLTDAESTARFRDVNKVSLSLSDISDCNSSSLRSLLSSIKGRSIPVILSDIDQHSILDETCAHIFDSASDIDELSFTQDLDLSDNEITWVTRYWNKIGKVLAETVSRLQVLEKIKNSDGHQPKIIYSNTLEYSKKILNEKRSDIEAIERLADRIHSISINVDDMEIADIDRSTLLKTKYLELISETGKNQSNEFYDYLLKDLSLEILQVTNITGDINFSQLQSLSILVLDGNATVLSLLGKVPTTIGIDTIQVVNFTEGTGSLPASDGWKLRELSQEEIDESYDYADDFNLYVFVPKEAKILESIKENEQI